MKKITVLVLLFSVTSIFGQIKSEKITPPNEGKSVVYFMRTTALGALMNFRFFDESNYLGKFNGVNYLRYECDPGKHIFWVLAENIDVLDADLAPDKIYIVETNAAMGGLFCCCKI